MGFFCIFMLVNFDEKQGLNLFNIEMENQYNSNVSSTN